MNSSPTPGQTWRIHPDSRKTDAQFFFIVLPTKHTPRPVDKGRASGYYLKPVKETPFFSSEFHHDHELVFLKSSIVRLSLKDLQAEVFLQPFYFYLRSQLESKRISNDAFMENVQEGAWKEEARPPRDDSAIDIGESEPESLRADFTMRFMLGSKKDRLLHLDQSVASAKRYNITSIQSFFERFIKAFARDEKKGAEGWTRDRVERYGIRTSDLMLQFNEFINPICTCSAKGFGREDELEVCRCGRIYHRTCKAKKGFYCQKCNLEKKGLASLSKRDDSQFKLDDLDFSKEMKEYREEFGDIPKNRLILKTSKELQSLNKSKSDSKSRRLDKMLSKAGPVSKKKRKIPANGAKTLTMDQKIQRTFESWSVDHFRIQRVRLKDKKRELMKSLLMKGLSLGVCEIMEDLRRYHKFLRAKDSTGGSKKKLTRYFYHMERAQNNLFCFLRNLYNSGIFQNLKDSGEKGIVRYLDQMAVKLESQLAKQNLRAFPRKYELYVKRGQLLGINLKRAHSKFLRFKILSKQLTYKEICSLGEEDLISEELKKKIEESKAEFWKERELNRESKYLIKNHKGDIEMEFIDKDKLPAHDDDFLGQNSSCGSEESDREDGDKDPLRESASDCEEIEMIDYRSKLKSKLEATELTFFDLAKENSNEIQLKQKEPEPVAPAEDSELGKRDSQKGKARGAGFDRKNAHLIRGVFEDAELLLPKSNGQDKARLGDGQWAPAKKPKKVKKKKKYTPEKIKARMMKRISKTLKPETVENLKGFLRQVVIKK